MQKYASLAVKEAVLRAIEQSRTTRNIADQFDIGKSTIADIYKRYKERNNNRVSLKSGRPRITSERQDKI